jgi:acyl carrier protein
VQTIEQDIRAFVEDSFLIGQDPTAFSDDTSFLEKGIIDSTGVLELVSYLEQCYSIQVSDEELTPENLDSIRRVAGFVRRKVELAQETAA